MLSVGVAWVLSLAAIPAARALPDPNAPIDPAKRARISTADAVRPAGMVLKGDGVIGGGVIAKSVIPAQSAAVAGERAAIDIRESREKTVMTGEMRAVEVRELEGKRRAADLPASIPRLDQRRFEKMLSAYERGRVPADALLNADVDPGRERATIDEINRYASPRRSLEAQGIPVVPAGSGQAGPSPSPVVPLPREKR